MNANWPFTNKTVERMGKGECERRFGLIIKIADDNAGELYNIFGRLLVLLNIYLLSIRV